MTSRSGAPSSPSRSAKLTKRRRSQSAASSLTDTAHTRQNLAKRIGYPILHEPLFEERDWEQWGVAPRPATPTPNGTLNTGSSGTTGAAPRRPIFDLFDEDEECEELVDLWANIAELACVVASFHAGDPGIAIARVEERAPAAKVAGASHSQQTPNACEIAMGPSRNNPETMRERRRSVSLANR